VVVGATGRGRRFKAALRAHSYDVVLDLQGLLKERMDRARGARRASWLRLGQAREPLATLAATRHAVAGPACHRAQSPTGGCGAGYALTVRRATA
jgi:ADP-heptose:LPS heptosyltransferase